MFFLVLLTLNVPLQIGKCTSFVPALRLLFTVLCGFNFRKLPFYENFCFEIGRGTNFVFTVLMNKLGSMLMTHLPFFVRQ